MNVLKNILFFGIFILAQLSFQVSAEGLTELTIDVPSQRGADAKQEVFDRAIEEATTKIAEEIVGAERMNRNWAQAKPRVLKNSTRYIMFIRGLAPVEKGRELSVPVQMRISTANLEAVLRESGMLAGGAVRILTLVRIGDGSGARYSWWTDVDEDASAKTSKEMLKKFFEQMQARFKGKNVFLLDPSNSSFRLSVPSTYRVDNLRKDDQMLLGQYLKADVILSGHVNVIKPEDGSEVTLDYKLDMWQSRTGRNLATVARSEAIGNDGLKVVTASMERIQPQIFEDLAKRLQEAVADGSLNLTVVRVAVEGNLNYQQREEFKKQLSSVRQIRLLRERMFEPSRVTYEAEASVPGSELGKVLAKSRFPSFRLDVESAQDDSLVLNVRAGASGR